VLGLLAVLTGFFTCSRASTSADGAIYAAALSDALDRNDVLRDTPVYVYPAIQRRTDRTSIEEISLARETQESILDHLGRSLVFADPDADSVIRVTLGAIEEQDDQRTVRVQLLRPSDPVAFVATYVLESRGSRWDVVQATSDGVMQPS
jgi:hypothetical protein